MRAGHSRKSKGERIKNNLVFKTEISSLLTISSKEIPVIFWKIINMQEKYTMLNNIQRPIHFQSNSIKTLQKLTLLFKI